MSQEPRGRGTVPSLPGASPPAQGKTSRNCNRNRNRRSQRSIGDPTFTGTIDKLKGHVYDIQAHNAGQILFATTTKEIARYFVKNNPKAGDFLNALDPQVLKFDNLTEPTRPANTTDPFEVEEWKIDMKQYKDAALNCTLFSKQAFALVLGQCSRPLCDRLEAHSKWADINSKCQVIELLKIICDSLFAGGIRREPDHALIEAEMKLNALVQGRDSAAVYHAKFRQIVETIKSLGSEIGITPANIKAALVRANVANPDKPTVGQLADARSKAQEKYLAIRFLLGCNCKRCGRLIADAVNAYHRGENSYPMTLDVALLQLTEFDNAGEFGSSDRQDSGMSFLQDGEPGSGRGYGGRGGTGGRGGRGSGHNNGREQHASSDGKSTSATINKSNPSVNGYVNVLHAESFLQDQSALPSKWLLLDSCSSVDLISNKELLHDIHDASNTMRVHCNAGTVKLTQQGYFGDYPSLVWYNPQGIDNILSLHNMSKIYQVRMDTTTENSIAVLKNGSMIVKFHPTAKGLYKCELSLEQPLWCLVNTVAENADRYTNRAYKNALTARHMQNIIMQPGSCWLKDVAISHLKTAQ